AFMSRRAIANGTLVTLLITGLIMTALQIPRFAAENAAEKKAVAAFEKLGGQVSRLEKKPDLSRLISWVWPAPTTVQALRLGHTKITDAGLEDLSRLKNLQTLWLEDTQVTDMGLKELAVLKSLQSLNLSTTHVTDTVL